MARASILWLIGEYCHLIPKISPDVLRKAAKTFTTEVSEVVLVVCSIYHFVNKSSQSLSLNFEN